MTWSVLACSVFTAICTFGQSLQITSVAGKPGDSVAVRIILDSQPEKSPATLQWEFVFPAQLLEFDQPAVERGTAAQSSGKSLTCAERNSYTQVCILTGGQRPIANGVIATAHLKIRANAKAGTTSIKVGKVQGVTSDLKQFDIKDAEAIVTIH